MKQTLMPGHIKTGQIGEDIVVKHLVKQGFKILERNYRKKWGEIDIIAEKNKILHFVEVKTVSYETLSDQTKKYYDQHQPEENVHFFKKKRLERAIQTYLAEKNVSYETFDNEGLEFQVDIAAVFLKKSTIENEIRITENVIL